jgi:hypothetical protein
MDAYDYLDQRVLVSLHLRALQLRGLQHVFHLSADEYQYFDINTISSSCVSFTEHYGSVPIRQFCMMDDLSVLFQKLRIPTSLYVAVPICRSTQTQQIAHNPFLRRRLLRER